MAFNGCRALAYVHQLLLRVVLPAAALPVAVGLVNGLQLLLEVLAIRLGLQVQRAAVAALRRGQIKGGEAALVHRETQNPSKHTWKRLQNQAVRASGEWNIREANYRLKTITLK